MKSCCLLILLWAQGLTCIQWTSDTANLQTTETCHGDNLTLPWAYVLDEGDVVETVKWLYAGESAGSAPDAVMIATYNYGVFMAVPSYAQRLSYAGDAGNIVLTGASVADSGTYAIEVISRNKNGVLSALHHTLDVRVEEELGQLTVKQTGHPVYDLATGQLHVQLECTGPKFSNSHLIVDVIWRTPSGSKVPSSSYNNGTYFLLLANPVKGGDYSCRLPPSAYKCQHGDTVSSGEATITVDAVTVRLTLLEAKEQVLNQKLEELRQENSNLRRAEILLQDELKVVKVGLNQTNATISKDIDVVQAKLNAYRVDKITPHVGFHAILGRSVELTSSQPVKFLQVEYNDGGAYNLTSGIFTAPVAGSYFFAFTTSPYLSDNNSNSYLSVRDRPVAKIYNQYGVGYYNTATGHAVVHLDFGEPVWVASMGSKTQFFDPLSFFSGFLIHADC